MRDQLDATLWIDHHAGLVPALDAALAKLGGVTGRIARGSAHRVLSLVAALTLSGLILDATVA